jgi:hypothetical protein
MQGTLAFIGPRETKALGKTGHVCKQPVSQGCKAVIWPRNKAGSKKSTRVTIKASRQAGKQASSGMYLLPTGVQEGRRSGRHAGNQAVIGGKASWCAGEHVAWTAVHRRQKGMHAGTMSVWMAGRQERKLGRARRQDGGRQAGRQAGMHAGRRACRQAGMQACRQACRQAGTQAGSLSTQAGTQVGMQAGVRKGWQAEGWQNGGQIRQSG